jgi:hypothetical protein
MGRSSDEIEGVRGELGLDGVVLVLVVVVLILLVLVLVLVLD